MSSTSRKPREGHDFYETPAWCVTRFLEAGALPNYGCHYLEPAAGNGAIVRADRAYRARTGALPNAWHMVEIDPQHTAALQYLQHEHQAQDFFKIPVEKGRFEVAMTNPPFVLAHAYVERLFAWECKYIALLLRLNFLGTASRANFLHKHPPDVFVLPDRPAFVGGTTDSIEYAWFVWRPLLRRSSGEIRVLAKTPLAERRALK